MPSIELRQEEAGKNETGYFKEYMAEAVAYIEEHLQGGRLVNHFNSSSCIFKPGLLWTYL